MTKAQIEALVYAHLAPNQPITSLGQHIPSMQVLIDELYEAQSRADVLSAAAVATSLASGDLVFIIRGAEARLASKDLFSGMKWRGAHSLASNLYPTNGSGSGGAVVAGDSWYVSVAGNLDLGTGAEPVPVKSILVALVNAPGQTPASWRVI
jgi:hypothetical protein